MFPAAFDPKPFIRTFEASVDQLISLRKDVQAKTEQMEKSVRVAEREYSKKMADLNRGFEVRHHSPKADITLQSFRAGTGCRDIVWRNGNEDE